jgi:hypothetical protein
MNPWNTDLASLTSSELAKAIEAAGFLRTKLRQHMEPALWSKLDSLHADLVNQHEQRREDERDSRERAAQASCFLPLWRLVPSQDSRLR